jgi:hypothetical protein
VSDIELIKSELPEEVSFLPAPIHQQLRAQFWARFAPSPFESKENITLATAQNYVNDSRLKRYWGTPGFKEWFCRQNENMERLEYLWSIGLDAAETILRDQTGQAGPKIQLLKLIAEVTNKLPKAKSEERFSDDKINKMNEDELNEFLAVRKVKPAKAKVE